MRIVVDALSSRIGGGRTYVKELLAEDAPPGLEVTVVVPVSADLGCLGRGVRVVPIRDWFARPGLRWMWEHLALPRLLNRVKADALFCPGGSLPRAVGSRRLLITMSRNMLPFDKNERRRYPTGYIKLRLATLERILVRSMMSADLVIFVSEYARDIVTERTGGRIGRSVVIPHGVGRQFRNAGPLQRPQWLPTDDYILYVSNFEPYKHQLSLVRAFASLQEARARGLKLALVGPTSSRQYTQDVAHDIERLGLGLEVMIHNNISQEELPGAYSNARVGVFASTCENCPNVLLEAMAAGQPLVVSSRPPMPEFARQSVLYCNPEVPSELAERIGELLEDPDLSYDLGMRAARESRNFDWATTASHTWAAIIDAWHDALERKRSF